MLQAIPSQPVISLELFRKVAQELAEETKKETSQPFLNYAGIIPINDPAFRYPCTPTNTEIFATTGGDGVHYSLLYLSEEVQPVVMTVPMNFGNTMNHYNWVIGSNLNEFLSIGFYNGWFPIEELCYNPARAIDFYSTENVEEYYQQGSDIQFVKKLRSFFGYPHIPLSLERLKELENKYFGYLQFNSEFVDTFIKK